MEQPQANTSVSILQPRSAKTKKEKEMKVLSIGTGREWEAFDQKFCNMEGASPDQKIAEIIHVDKIYEGSEIPDLVGEDIFTYLENYNYRDFDVICAQRVFEHIPVDQIGYLLYLLYTTASDKASIEIIVPDFEAVLIVLNELDADKQIATEFNKHLIQVTTELFNEPSDPHRSAWTKKLAKYYLELEGYWKISDIEYVCLDGRDWYLKIRADRQ